MRIVLDENLPRPLTRIFGPTHQVATVQELDLSGTSNGELLALLEGQHDDVVIADLDFDLICEVRNTWQFYRDRRPETYDSLVKL